MCGYIDPTGRYASAPRPYLVADDFTEGLAAVRWTAQTAGGGVRPNAAGNWSSRPGLGRSRGTRRGWLHLPGPPLPLTDIATAKEAEEAVASAGLDPMDMLKLTRPSRFAYCYVSDPLRRAMESAGVTGVRFGTVKLFR